MVHVSHYRLLKTLVFVGMMGSGKTAVGRAVASALDVEFRDSDREIEAAAGMTISQIFACHGEEYFREKESQVLSRLLTGPPCSLSVGGGVFMSADNRDMIEKRGVSIWLKVDPELLWRRVKHKATRPLLQTKNPFATLKQILAERTPYYSHARVWVHAEAGLSVPEMASKVIASLVESPVGPEILAECNR